MDKVIITAALTGPIARKADNPAVPATPEEIAASAKGAYEAGAAIVHIHLRDNDEPTVSLDVAQRTVEAVHAVCPAIIQLSTGGLDIAYEERMRIVESRPLMATLNPCTMTFALGEFRNPPDKVPLLATRMKELGIKPELEIYDTGHLDMMLDMLKKELIAEPLQVSFVMGVRGGMAADPEILAYLVKRLPVGTSWQVIAIGRANLPLTAIGLAMGGNARTGLEDTLLLEKGRPASSNAELVERLVGVARAVGREPATVDEVVARLGLSTDNARPS
jgi:3-keto-5-aminohexanoate cleavage enzyme